MANASLKKDFKDGDILFSQQLNNNFGAIEAALATMNKIVWQDDPDDSVVTFRGTTEEVNAREIIDGQLLYDTTTGETYIDYGSQRISTGSGNAIYIGTGTPSNPSTQLWINPEESILPINTEVVNSMEGSETTKAPSVDSVKTYINDKVQDVYSTDEVKTNKLWIDNKPIYRKVFVKENIANGSNEDIELSFDSLVSISGIVEWNNSYSKHNVYWISAFTGSSNERCDVVTTTNGLSFRNRTSVTVKLNLIVEYTKTTDGGGN